MHKTIMAERNERAALQQQVNTVCSQMQALAQGQMQLQQCMMSLCASRATQPDAPAATWPHALEAPKPGVEDLVAHALEAPKPGVDDLVSRKLLEQQQALEVPKHLQPKAQPGSWRASRHSKRSELRSEKDCPNHKVRP